MDTPLTKRLALAAARAVIAFASPLAAQTPLRLLFRPAGAAFYCSCVSARLCVQLSFCLPAMACESLCLTKMGAVVSAWQSG